MEDCHGGGGKNCLCSEWDTFVSGLYGVDDDPNLREFAHRAILLKRQRYYAIAEARVPETQSISNTDLVKAYDETHPYWSLSNAIHKTYYMNWVYRYIREMNITSALDVGCGLGEVLIFLFIMKLIRGRVVGVDASESIIAKAKALSKEYETSISFKHAFADKIDLPDGRFKLITHKDVLHWTTKWLESLHEACRLLAPEGLLLLTYQPDCSYKRCNASPETVADTLKQSGLNVLEIAVESGEESGSRYVFIAARKEK